MRHLLCILTLCAGIANNAGAQSFTQRIQQVKSGQGNVAIHQSAEIDALVNDAKLGYVGNTIVASKQTTASTNLATASPKPNTPPIQKTYDKLSADTAATSTTTEPTTTEPAQKTGRMYKTMGYRVQAFAGGNSRKDRQQAERIGNQIRASFPDVAVYVHFYSPRWICRVGNYRTYEEAHEMKRALTNMGYNQCIIVKGKITVYY